VLADEFRIGARPLDKRADLFAALGAGLGGKGTVTIGGELFESVSHRLIPLIRIGQIAELRDYAGGGLGTRPAAAERLP
jgi:hypothetical protein